ncbi:hypothetical protein ACVIIV_006870 [Bradyrhizobium sp. USDA 4354]
MKGYTQPRRRPVVGQVVTLAIFAMMPSCHCFARRVKMDFVNPKIFFPLRKSLF